MNKSECGDKYKDFIYESNKGNDFYFVSTKEEAIERLAKSR